MDAQLARDILNALYTFQVDGAPALDETFAGAENYTIRARATPRLWAHLYVAPRVSDATFEPRFDAAVRGLIVAGDVTTQCAPYRPGHSARFLRPDGLVAGIIFDEPRGRKEPVTSFRAVVGARHLKAGNPHSNGANSFDGVASGEFLTITPAGVAKLAARSTAARAADTANPPQRLPTWERAKYDDAGNDAIAVLEIDEQRIELRTENEKLVVRELLDAKGHPLKLAHFQVAAENPEFRADHVIRRIITRCPGFKDFVVMPRTGTGGGYRLK